MFRRIHLHGLYKDFHDGPITVFATTVWEAIEAVTHQLPGFAPDLQGPKILQVVGFQTLESLKSPTDVVDLHFMPHMSFGKEAGLIEVVVGLTLIVIAAFMGGVFWPAIVASAGVSMVVGGLTQMLTPQPKAKSNPEASKYLASTQNTVKIGTPIAILYGMYRLGGQLLSLQINSKNT